MRREEQEGKRGRRGEREGMGGGQIEFGRELLNETLKTLVDRGR